jgi:hypothetical protein
MIVSHAKGKKEFGAYRLFSKEQTGKDHDACIGPQKPGRQKNIPGLVSSGYSRTPLKGNIDVQSPGRKEIYLIAYR